MARKAKKRLFCLDPRKGGAGHRVCLPYSDYNREDRDFALRAMKTAASVDGGIISSCDTAQKSCYVVARPLGVQRMFTYTLLAIAAGSLWVARK